MKINISKYLLIPLSSVMVLACSTKKDAFLNRGYHALTTKYNILYNGNIAFEKGVANLRANYHDDFWEILPIERMQVEEDLMAEDQSKDVDFQLAEEKAAKAIQKHSMYIAGREKNPQMVQAYLLLGKSRYYDNRFIPALESFNYILYKSPSSNLINQAKVWREKTNLRLMYDELAIQNLKEMFKEEYLKGQVKADAYATLAQAYINLNHLDSASVSLKKALDLTSLNEEKARYNFILGQLYKKRNKNGEAVAFFKKVIAMNRKSPKEYVMHSYANIYADQNIKASDSIVFLKKIRGLLKDRENRPYLDLINRQLGMFYEKNGNDEKAILYLKTALAETKGDEKLLTKNYIDLAEIYLKTSQYELAGEYFDKALVILPERNKETYRITKKRESLNDVMLYEKTARENDSILLITGMSDSGQTAYFQEYIDRVRKEDVKKLNAQLNRNVSSNADYLNMPDFGSVINQSNTISSVFGSRDKTDFYFYSQKAVAYGKIEFKKRWGNRELQDSWKWRTENKTIIANKDYEDYEDNRVDTVETNAINDTRYSVDFYKSQLPTDAEELKAIKKDRDFAYFQLGSIYSDKFAEFELAAGKLEKLLLFDPEERLLISAMHKLYKIYSSIDPEKAARLKERIIVQYPNSRYALLLQNKEIPSSFEETSEQVYARLFQEYKKGDYVETLKKVNSAIEEYVGDDYLSKFELLKANMIGRLEGVKAYKDALSYVALTYASTSEGKEADRIFNHDIPLLESKQFTKKDSGSWKIIYVINASDMDASALMESKLKRYVFDRNKEEIKFSRDYYTYDKVFFVIHGMSSEANAKEIASFLRNANQYKVDKSPNYITSENYFVVQINKNWNEFLKLKKE